MIVTRISSGFRTPTSHIPHHPSSDFTILRPFRAMRVVARCVFVAYRACPILVRGEIPERHSRVPASILSKWRRRTKTSWSRRRLLKLQRTGSQSKKTRKRWWPVLARRADISTNAARRRRAPTAGRRLLLPAGSSLLRLNRIRRHNIALFHFFLVDFLSSSYPSGLGMGFCSSVTLQFDDPTCPPVIDCSSYCRNC